MKLTNKNLLYLAAFVLVGYLIYREWKKKKPLEVDTTKTVAQAKQEIAATKPVQAKIDNFTVTTELKKGDKGGMVELLQIALNVWLLPGSKVTVDGIFGSGTESAIYKLYGKRTASFQFVSDNKPTKQGYSYSF